jgi:hypothetical protein
MLSLQHVPSSFECDCGHRSHFFENTVREAEAASRRRGGKPFILLDSEDEGQEHGIEFLNGAAAAILCPERGHCLITGCA